MASGESKYTLSPLNMLKISFQVSTNNLPTVGPWPNTCKEKELIKEEIAVCLECGQFTPDTTTLLLKGALFSKVPPPCLQKINKSI